MLSRGCGTFSHEVDPRGFCMISMTVLRLPHLKNLSLTSDYRPSRSLIVYRHGIEEDCPLETHRIERLSSANQPNRSITTGGLYAFPIRCSRPQLCFLCLVLSCIWAVWCVHVGWWEYNHVGVSLSVLVVRSDDVGTRRTSTVAAQSVRPSR